MRWLVGEPSVKATVVVEDLSELIAFVDRDTGCAGAGSTSYRASPMSPRRYMLRQRASA
jgi:hypothetical protein